LTIGDILAFNVYIALLTFPLTAMGIILAVYQRARTAIDRIQTIEEAEPEGQAISEAAPATDTANLVEVQNLNFTYSSGSFSLENISFTLPPGKKLGLFGPIGSGKTTLLNLIVRLKDPPPGTIFWQGRDVLAIAPRSLRAGIGYALQNPHLFSESIRANLLFGASDKSEEDLAEATNQAAVAGDIERMNDKMETEIGEKGVRLSGGQKQRLSLARAFLKRPALLILDDVLSAVDHTTELELIGQIHKTGSALIITSHRGTALKGCDEILVLDAGRIIGRGRYHELVKKFPALQTDE